MKTDYRNMFQKSLASVLFALFFCYFITGKAKAEDYSTQELLSYPRLLAMVHQERGKVVVLNFFASWCPPCKKEIPHLSKAAKTYKDDIVIIGVSFDEDQKALDDFLDNMKPAYKIVRAGEQAAGFFEVKTIPRTIFYSKKGARAVDIAGYISEERMHSEVKKMTGKL